ncbi:Transglycosylase [Polaromonas sp. YR568]|uniref:biosynthetic peptidoglycan transglycosylase n=1 Tax=Polaromonas sp. YR568 TaxID=1855301 RepID=UPI0008DEF09E|nr:biosynthetic peptidoglycan transglycosylase [Polaromonas sp. YR568]SFU72406.1 Transglycosylase [Polaromonas sp. YR568]
MKPRRAKLWVWVPLGMLALLALLASALLALYFVVKAVLAPLPGEWSVPLRVGPLQMQAGVPTLIRLATAPWVGPLLQGRTLPARTGPVHMTWLARSQVLALRCAPCRVQAPGLGKDPLTFNEVQLTVRRRGDQLDGEVSAGKLRATWQGVLARDQLRLRLQLPTTPIADGYALFGAAIPELAQAHIEGRFALQATLVLPGASLSVVPQVEGLQVSGLGTEALVTARSACGKSASRLTTSSWLARAVVAAEDQRFYEHSGFDLTELTAALARNQGAGQEGRIERGGSTLSQQLAKLLVTGGERSPVRKLRELLYAAEMERTLGKPRILQLYLAHAPWGPGLCGAEAASRRYFGRAAHELSPTQAAWLAAMLHNPGLEARRWAETGQINVARTQWVILAMRPLPSRQRIRLAEEAKQLNWPAPVLAP